MKVKRLVLIVIIFLILGIAALWKKGVFKQEAQNIGNVFPELTSKQIIQIYTKKKEKETILEKINDRWVVANKGNYPIGKNFAEDLLKKLAEVKIDRVASKQSEKYAQFEVDAETGLEVKLFGKDNKPLNHFYLGKQGTNFNSNYLRKEGAQEVLMTTENISYLLNRNEWREHQLFNATAEEVKEITLKFTEEEITLSQDKEKGWQLIKPKPGNAQKEEVTKLFNNLRALRVKQFLEEKPKDSDSGLSTPELKISWTLKNGSQHSLNIGNKKDASRYAQQEGIDVVVLVPESRTKPLWDATNKLKKPAPYETKETKESEEKTKKPEKSPEVPIKE